MYLSAPQLFFFGWANPTDVSFHYPRGISLYSLSLFRQVIFTARVSKSATGDRLKNLEAFWLSERYRVVA